jgi:DNA-binding transcriptional ArsR family regulator
MKPKIIKILKNPNNHELLSLLDLKNEEINKLQEENDKLREQLKSTTLGELEERIKALEVKSDSFSRFIKYSQSSSLEYPYTGGK